MSVSTIHYQFRRTTILVIGCIAFLTGVEVAKHSYLLQSWAWMIVVPFGLCVRRRNWLAVVWICLFGVVLGWCRGSIYMLKQGAISMHYGEKIAVRVVASQDGVYSTTKQLTFDVSGMRLKQSGEKLSGKFSISGFGENAVFAGDTVEVTGKLKPSLGSYQGRMSFAQLQVVRHHSTIVTDIRRRFTAGLQSVVPEPLASFGMGLLIGQRNTLPPNVSQDLLSIGLTHIIAASGYNLMIILRSIEKVMGKRSKRLTVGVAGSLIILFLLLAGTSASIVRAAIVSMFSIVAGYYGRQFKPLVLLGLSAVISAWLSPYFVWSDAGWALSFLSFYGVLIVAPLIHERITRRWQDSLLVGVAIESVSAEIMTVPFILHVFGQMSFAGLVANVLVAVLVPLAMLLSLIAGLAGTFLPLIAGWFAWPATILLTYMLDTAHLLARIPHVFVSNTNLTTWQMITGYVIVVGLCTALQYKSKRAIITEIKDVKRGTHVRTQQVVND